MLFETFQTYSGVIFSKVIINRKKKLAVRKVDKISPPFSHLSPLPVTSSSDKHHNEPMFLCLSLSISIIYQLIYT